jgi:hypothetical protein
MGFFPQGWFRSAAHPLMVSHLGIFWVWLIISTAMKFEIRSVQNGVVLKVDHGSDDGESEEIVYQETDDNEIEAFADFLHFLNDHYGPSTSRYSPKRIRIAIEPGDKWQGDGHQIESP